MTAVHLGSVSTDMDEQARGYGPLRLLAEQSGGRDITPMPVLIDKVVSAVVEGREEVRVPAMMAPLAALTNAPRRVMKLAFAHVPAREDRTDR